MAPSTAPADASPPPPATPPCRRIQVSREKRPLNFFVALSKKFLQTDEVVELSGLGLAVTTVVTIAEILRTSGFVFLDDIQTSLVEPHPDAHSYAPKAKIQIWIRRTPQFEALMANSVNTHNSSSRSAHAPVAAPASAADAGDTNPPSPAATTAEHPAATTAATAANAATAAAAAAAAPPPRS